MGAGASAEISSAVRDASPDDLRLALAAMPQHARSKLNAMGTVQQEPQSTPSAIDVSMPRANADLNEARLGPEGAAALALAIALSGSMMRLDVRWANYDMGTEGEEALRKAIEGRLGFELLL